LIGYLTILSSHLVLKQPWYICNSQQSSDLSMHSTFRHSQWHTKKLKMHWNLFIKKSRTHSRTTKTGIKPHLLPVCIWCLITWKSWHVYWVASKLSIHASWTTEMHWWLLWNSQLCFLAPSLCNKSASDDGNNNNNDQQNCIINPSLLSITSEDHKWLWHTFYPVIALLQHSLCVAASVAVFDMQLQ